MAGFDQTPQDGNGVFEEPALWLPALSTVLVSYMVACMQLQARFSDEARSDNTHNSPCKLPLEGSAASGFVPALAPWLAVVLVLVVLVVLVLRALDMRCSPTVLLIMRAGAASSHVPLCPSLAPFPLARVQRQ